MYQKGDVRVKRLSEISPFKQMKEFFGWLAQNVGVKHPVISTVAVMIIAGIGWNVFVRYVVGTKSEGSQPSITQKAGDAQCSNIVVTGGSVSATCPTGNGKTDDTEKKDAAPPNQNR